MQKLRRDYAQRWWSSDDGLRLFARDYTGSEGKTRLPVICLHGLTRNSADFEGVAPYLSRLDRRVLVLDMRGRGLSEYDLNFENYHLLVYARDVIDLCQSLGIAKAHFIGTSMGGLITMVIATLRPDLIASSVLNDIGPFLSPIGLGRIADAKGRQSKGFRNWAEAADYCKLRNGLAFPENSQADWLDFAKRTMKKSGTRLRPAYDPKLFDAFTSPNPSMLIDYTKAFRDLSSDRKTLLVRGAISDLITEVEAQQMQDLAPEMARIDIDNIGHAPMLTEEAARHAIIEHFSDQL